MLFLDVKKNVGFLFYSIKKILADNSHSNQTCLLASIPQMRWPGNEIFKCLKRADMLYHVSWWYIMLLEATRLGELVSCQYAVDVESRERECIKGFKFSIMYSKFS
jgi:hypothetical protein